MLPAKPWVAEAAADRNLRRARLGGDRPAELLGGAGRRAHPTDEIELQQIDLFTPAQLARLNREQRARALLWNRFFEIRNEAVAEHRRRHGTEPPAVGDGIRASRFYAHDAVLSITEQLPYEEDDDGAPEPLPSDAPLTLNEAITRLELVEARAQQIAADIEQQQALAKRRLEERKAKRDERARPSHAKSPPHKKRARKPAAAAAEHRGSAALSGSSTESDGDGSSSSEEETPVQKRRRRTAAALKIGKAGIPAAALRR